jgi:ankyrin repeat protein
MLVVGCGNPEADKALINDIIAGDIISVRQDLANGADVNAKNERGETPLHIAARKGRNEIAELLIANGADVNAKTKSGTTPLHLAAWKGHKEIAELLIESNADFDLWDKNGETPLDFAIKYNKTEIADLLRKHGGKTREELK